MSSSVHLSFAVFTFIAASVQVGLISATPSFSKRRIQDAGERLGSRWMIFANGLFLFSRRNVTSTGRHTEGWLFVSVHVLKSISLNKPNTRARNTSSSRERFFIFAIAIEISFLHSSQISSSSFALHAFLLLALLILLILSVTSRSIFYCSRGHIASGNELSLILSRRRTRLRISHSLSYVILYSI